MAIQDTIDRIAEVLRGADEDGNDVPSLDGVEGLRVVYNRPPASLNDADMPCAVILPGPARYSPGELKETREYIIWLFAAPVSHGVGGEAAGRVNLLIRRVAMAFALADHLESESVLRADLSGDGGVTTLAWWGKPLFLGVEFRLSVEEIPVVEE